MPNPQTTTETKGAAVRAFLQSQYDVELRFSEGSQNVAFVTRREAPRRRYRVSFQFARLSIFGCENHYGAIECTCPRFAKVGNCHHTLLVFEAHAKNIGESFPVEHFAQYELSKANKTEFLKALAA